MRSRLVGMLLAVSALIVGTVVPPQPAMADYPDIRTVATITNTSADVSIRGLTGQSSCTVEINGTATGDTIGYENGMQALLNSVKLPDGGTPATSITGPGTFTANCAGMQAFAFHPTAVTGSVTITVLASGAVGRIIGAGVNGGKTNVVGAAPITVTNSGNTATVGLTTPLTVAQGGTNATALPTGCLQSNGTAISSTGAACTSTSSFSVQAGTGIGVATPSPGVFVVSNTGVTAVSGTGNIASTGGTTPVVSITAAPSFSDITLTGFVGTSCLDVNGSDLIIAAPEPCPISKTNGTFVIPAVGSSVSVTTINPPYFPNVANTPIYITDGTHAMSGLVTAGQNTNTLTVVNEGMIAGSVGNTMATSAYVGSGGSGVPIVSSVSGTGNISSTGGTTPVVSITNAPTFSGSITSTSTGSVLSSTNGYIQLNTSNSSAPAGFFVGTTGAGGQNPQAYAVSNSTNFYTSMGSDSLHTVATVPGTCLHFAEYNGVTYSSALASLDCSGNMGIAGVMHATSFAGSGAGLASGTVPNASLVTAPVTSVTGSGNMASSGGTTPDVTITNAPTFTGALSASTLTASSHSADSGNCVQFGVGGILGSSGSACGGGGVVSAQYVLSVANFSVPNFDFAANRAINASQTYATATNDLLKGATIKTISVTCVPFQAADPNTPYSIGNQGFDPTVTGIKGGVLTLQDYGASGSTTIGTLTLADSAAGGPYVNHATTTLGSPYTVPASDVVFVDVSGTNAGASSSWQGCLATVGV